MVTNETAKEKDLGADEGQVCFVLCLSEIRIQDVISHDRVAVALSQSTHYNRANSVWALSVLSTFETKYAFRIPGPSWLHLTKSYRLNGLSSRARAEILV